MSKNKESLRLKRKKRIRMKLYGTEERPRLILRRSLNNLEGQIIDDTKKRVVFGLSTLDKEIRTKLPSGGNVKAAELFGTIFAQRMREKGIHKIIFDRAGYLYHGRVKAFAEALRKAGLEF